MSIWEIIAVILISAVAFGFVTISIAQCISKIIDAKASAKVTVTTAVFRNECEYLDKLFDKYMTRIEKMVNNITNKDKPEPPKIGFGG